MTEDASSEAPLSVMDEPMFDERPTVKLLNDDCWGNMELPSFLFDFIDTPSFKRLKRLKQLGTCYEVWTGATHNRFEHSLGTAHLATRLLNRFKHLQPEQKITHSEFRCVTLAALLHDLGHGILSHVFDNTFYPKARPNEKWTHEDASVMMIDYTIDANSIDIEPEEVKLIKDLIQGQRSLTTGNDRMFLFDIVSNKRNSIDTDKWDYITRDCRNLNMPGYDIERLMSNAWVMEDQICYAYKQPDDVLGGTLIGGDRNDLRDVNVLPPEHLTDFFQTRFRLHKKVYGHAVAKSYEFMYVDALLAADSYLGISESVHDPSKYVTMSDGIFDTIRSLRHTVPELEKSAEILDKIDRRQHYRFVDSMFIPIRVRRKIDESVVTPEAIATFRASSGFAASEIIVDFVRQNYSPLDKVKNPLANVKFYKRTEDVCEYINMESISNVVPQTFEDVRVRCFLRDTDRNRVAALQDIFRDYMDDLVQGLSGGDVSPESQDESFLGAETRGLFTRERRRESMKLQPNQLLTAGVGESSPRKRRMWGDFDGASRESTPHSSPDRMRDRKKMAL